MVQRKVANKLTLQIDLINKTKNQFPNLKSPSSLHHPVELKTKKMKKSGSFKLDSPRSRRHVKPPAKPPHKQTPNYMKPTTSSDARKEVSSKSPQTSSITSRNSKLKLASSTKTSLKTMRTLTKNPSFKHARAKKCSKVVMCDHLDVQRATCSSTLKDCKFPTYLKLSNEGTESEGQSAIKVCPYTYCSLNGHHHRPPLPPLKCFLSTKRIMIKNQRSLKLGCLSPRRVKPIGDDINEKIYDQDDLKSSGVGEENTDFFIEIFTKEKEEQTLEILSDGSICSDRNGDVDPMDINDTYLLEQNEENGIGDEVSLSSSVQAYSEASDMSMYFNDYYEYSSINEVLPDLESEVQNDVMHDEFIIESDNKGGCFNEYMGDEVSQESFDEESFNSDPFSSCSDGEPIDSYDYIESSITEKTSSPLETLHEEPKPDNDDKNEFPIEDNIQNQDQFDKECNQSGPAKCKKPIGDWDELGHHFNPRAPNFLPLDPDQESEKVDLRHQELDEKKNADEWMVDYALRQEVTKLGPVRKRKVELLVEAFEKVMPITKCELHLRHSSGFDHERTIQACN